MHKDDKKSTLHSRPHPPHQNKRKEKINMQKKIYFSNFSLIVSNFSLNHPLLFRFNSIFLLLLSSFAIILHDSFLHHPLLQSLTPFSLLQHVSPHFWISSTFHLFFCWTSGRNIFPFHTQENLPDQCIKSPPFDFLLYFICLYC